MTVLRTLLQSFHRALRADATFCWVSFWAFEQPNAQSPPLGRNIQQHGSNCKPRQAGVYLPNKPQLEIDIVTPTYTAYFLMRGCTRFMRSTYIPRTPQYPCMPQKSPGSRHRRLDPMRQRRAVRLLLPRFCQLFLHIRLLIRRLECNFPFIEMRE